MSKKPAHKAPGSVADVRARLWEAIAVASAIAGDTDADPSLRLKGVHGVVQGSGAYLRVLEVVDIEARLTALEEQSGFFS